MRDNDMGLGTSHDCWHGPYSAFMRFRLAIAKSLSIPLELMEGFYDGLVPDYAAISPPHVRQRMERIHAERLPIKWSALRPDPIHVLLNHSDCDGSIEVADLIPLADRLEAIAPALSEPESQRALQFATGCRVAAASGERVEFH